MGTVRANFDLSKVVEYTVEAGRPDCTDAEKLAVIKEYGATRISINPQTFSDEVLAGIGRKHSCLLYTSGLRAYERKIAGYTAPEAILTGLETRTSSPVRLKREENFECTQLAGLYPCGEGAGYAGGIMSAAVDGLRVARAIISRYTPAEG